MKPTAAALLALLLLQQPEEKWCDVEKTQPRDYCNTCAFWPATEQIDKGLCKKCRSRLEKVETCIKVYWDCPKAHDHPKRHAKNCGASPGCCREFPSLSVVSYACETCNREARKRADVKHGSEKCEGKIRKKCALSGRFPHGGEEPR